MCRKRVHDRSPREQRLAEPVNQQQGGVTPAGAESPELDVVGREPLGLMGRSSRSRPIEHDQESDQPREEDPPRRKSQRAGHSSKVTGAGDRAKISLVKMRVVGVAQAIPSPWGSSPPISQIPAGRSGSHLDWGVF